jgi:ABC-2 type transport system ATP-binding protein
VRGVGFTIEPGEIFGLLGPNGAGKTTTVECLIGLREPDSGHIEVCGFDARRYPQEVKQRIGVALQSTSLQDKVTPREALRLFRSFYRAGADPEALLERFDLRAKADAPVDSLSGGQRQRLALALAFVNRPELVFLDEPTTGLDPQAKRNLWDLVLELNKSGMTIVLTTHNMEEAEFLCDRLAIMDHGKVIAEGTPQELIMQYAPDAPPVPRHGNLEDVFLRLTGSALRE